MTLIIRNAIRKSLRKSIRRAFRKAISKGIRRAKRRRCAALSTSVILNDGPGNACANGNQLFVSLFPCSTRLTISLTLSRYIYNRILGPPEAGHKNCHKTLIILKSIF